MILTGWAVWIVVAGVLLRNGMGAESLAWTLMFVLLPLICVYYPVNVLPYWLQLIAWSLPPTYVFEGMRALLMEHLFRADLMIEAFLLNALYFGAAGSPSWPCSRAHDAPALSSKPASRNRPPGG